MRAWRRSTHRPWRSSLLFTGDHLEISVPVVHGEKALVEVWLPSGHEQVPISSGYRVGVLE